MIAWLLILYCLIVYFGQVSPLTYPGVVGVVSGLINLVSVSLECNSYQYQMSKEIGDPGGSGTGRVY